MIISIIPARGGSKGIPKKNIITVAGKPLLAWTIEQSLNSKNVDSTYVTTNDDEIAEVAREHGAGIIWRPESISGDEASSEAALLHALDYLREEEKMELDIVVFLQCTSPLRKKNDIDNAIQMFKDENADSVFSGSEIEDFLFWECKDGELQSANYDYENRGIRQHRNPQFVENGSIYLFKPGILKENNNRIGGKVLVYNMEFWQNWEIDKIDDIPLLEYYLNNEIKTNIVSPTMNIELVVLDFDGVLTDNRVLTLQDGTEGVLSNRADGLAIKMLHEKGIPVIILSTEENPVVLKRALKLQIPCIQSVTDKKQALIDYCKENSVELDNVVFLGNDINDIDAMQISGHPVCPSDAYEAVKSISEIVLASKGGEGFVREFVDLVLR